MAFAGLGLQLAASSAEPAASAWQKMKGVSRLPKQQDRQGELDFPPRSQVSRKAAALPSFQSVLPEIGKVQNPPQTDGSFHMAMQALMKPREGGRQGFAKIRRPMRSSAENVDSVLPELDGGWQKSVPSEQAAESASAAAHSSRQGGMSQRTSLWKRMRNQSEGVSRLSQTSKSQAFGDADPAPDHASSNQETSVPVPKKKCEPLMESFAEKLVEHYGSLERAFHAFAGKGKGEFTRSQWDASLDVLRADVEDMCGVSKRKLFSLMDNFMGKPQGAVREKAWFAFFKKYLEGTASEGLLLEDRGAPQRWQRVSQQAETLGQVARSFPRKLTAVVKLVEVVLETRIPSRQSSGGMSGMTSRPASKERATSKRQSMEPVEASADIHHAQRTVSKAASFLDKWRERSNVTEDGKEHRALSKDREANRALSKDREANDSVNEKRVNSESGKRGGADCQTGEVQAEQQLAEEQEEKTSGEKRTKQSLGTDCLADPDDLADPLRYDSQSQKRIWGDAVRQQSAGSSVGQRSRTSSRKNTLTPASVQTTAKPSASGVLGDCGFLRAGQTSESLKLDTVGPGEDLGEILGGARETRNLPYGMDKAEQRKLQSGSGEDEVNAVRGKDMAEQKRLRSGSAEDEVNAVEEEEKEEDEEDEEEEEEEDDEEASLQSLIIKVFKRYATGRSKGKDVFIRNPDLGAFAADVKDAMPRATRTFKRFKRKFESVFDDTIQLQCDMAFVGQRVTAGLTLEWFQVFVQKIVHQLGLEVIGFFLALLNHRG